MKTEDIITSLYMAQLPAVNKLFSHTLGAEIEAWYRCFKDTLEDGSYREENWFLTRDRVIVSVATGDSASFTVYERSNFVRVDKSYAIKLGWSGGKEVIPTAVSVVLAVGESLEVPPPRDHRDHWASKYNDFVSKL